MDTDQARRFVGPGLCPNCLQKNEDDLKKHLNDDRKFNSISSVIFSKNRKKCKIYQQTRVNMVLSLNGLLDQGASLTVTAKDAP